MLESDDKITLTMVPGRILKTRKSSAAGTAPSLIEAAVSIVIETITDKRLRRERVQTVVEVGLGNIVVKPRRLKTIPDHLFQTGL